MLKKKKKHVYTHKKKKERQHNENGTKKNTGRPKKKKKLCPVEEWSVAPKTEKKKTLKRTRRCACICPPGSTEVPRQEGKPPFLPSRPLDHTQIYNREKKKKKYALMRAAAGKKKKEHVLNDSFRQPMRVFSPFSFSSKRKKPSASLDNN